VVDKAPGKPLDPWLREFLELALSKEGQALIASMTTTHGFVPLEARDLPRERAKIE
jgi:phosphate transport system substrate-binding protein